MLLLKNSVPFEGLYYSICIQRVTLVGGSQPDMNPRTNYCVVVPCKGSNAIAIIVLLDKISTCYMAINILTS